MDRLVLAPAVKWAVQLVLTCAVSVSAASDSTQALFGTWARSPVGSPTAEQVGAFHVPSPTVIGGTIRYRLRIAQGGRRLRLRFSNEYGSEPLELATVSVGMAAEGLNAVPGSLVRVTFGGNSGITIAPGAPALSDVIEFPVKSLSNLLVSVFVQNGLRLFVCSEIWSATDQAVVEAADATLVDQLPSPKCMFTASPLVSAADVIGSVGEMKVVVALGDSITDGVLDPQTADRGWPGVLARRLSAAAISVVNAGISGNRLTRSTPVFGASALARLDRDVLSVPGLTHIIVLEGINDIGMSEEPGKVENSPPVNGSPLNSPPVEPGDLIAAYLQVIERAHVRGVRVIGATLLPFEGSHYYSSAKDKVRESVNAWIRTSGKFDGVIDFEASLRDPAHPRKLKAEYDSGDHLHLNPLGYRVMGEMIEPRAFGGRIAR